MDLSKLMTLSNLLELAALLLIIAGGIAVWLYCKRKLQDHDGFEGVVTERGNLPARRKLSVEEEIQHLEGILNKK